MLNKIDKLELLRCKRLWHTCSETVVSFDLRKLPPYIRKNIPIQEYELALQLPVLPAGNLLLVNEAFDEWKTVRDLLVSIDTLPRSLLEDIFTMEKKRYPDKEKASVLDGLPAGEQARRIIFMFLPQLLAAQKKDHL